MIKSSSRVGSIGASDTRFVMMNWNTKTFENWWGKKLGILPSEELDNKYVNTGTMLEIPVINKVNEVTGLDIKLGEEPLISCDYTRLKVNLDGYTNDTIYEIKCVGFTKAFNWQFKLDKNYVQQCQVQMYVSDYRKCYLVAYGLEPHEYDFMYWINPCIDFDRIFMYEVEYDEKFIAMYRKRLEYLIECIEQEKYPDKKEFNTWK